MQITHRPLRLFSLAAILAAFLTSASFAATRSIILTSDEPAKRWEDALISGNGIQGVMVHGSPLDETVVLNHEKCWVPAQPVKPDVPNMVQAVERAREHAKKGEFGPAGSILWNEFGKGNAEMFPAEALIRNGPRLGLNYVHPAGRLQISMPKQGDISNYRRTLELDTGEINVHWTDKRGDWTRSTFVSRPQNAIVTRLLPPDDAKLSCSLALTQRPGWDANDIADPKFEHLVDRESAIGEMYLSTHYKHLHGLTEPDGYQVLMRVYVSGGSLNANDKTIVIEKADEVLVVGRINYLPVAANDGRDQLRDELNGMPRGYDQLLASHAKVHGELFRRVRFDLGGGHANGKTIEQILAEADANGPTPEFLELIYAVGRYCLISSSGELPPTLMGIWGDTWKPMWWGHYTNDSNLNLAVSGGSVGNLPEAMESYFGWIETLYPDWERNANQLYGVDGYMGAIAHGWRHGSAIAAWHEWTGASGWLGAYFWQHYLLTGDREFLAERVVPLLENIVTFYEGFLAGMEQEDGQFFIFPSISPENKPKGFSGNAPNATSEIAIIRATFTSLIQAYKELGIKQERIPELEAFLAKVPNYRINDDGAIAEWSFPGIPENYNHRHNSHLHAVYPGIDINPATPRLYEAAKVAIRKRIGAGQGNKSAHGFMELGFYGSRLQSPSIVWNMLDDYARSKFLYRSFISSHNPDHRIYNLDSILALPAILTEMCLYSRPGELNLLPGIPPDKLPQGEIAGILARKAILVDELKWDLPARRIDLVATSQFDQRVVISSRLHIESVSGPGVTRDDRGAWRVQLPAGETSRFEITVEAP